MEILLEMGFLKIFKRLLDKHSGIKNLVDEMEVNSPFSIFGYGVSVNLLKAERETLKNYGICNQTTKGFA
ncbi:MAG TPA: hypothetical protein PKK23_13790 [Nitrospirales bacterium]|nr:hypothetical protein [Nitrospiraceae bacterium]HNP30114.1 hypothetical protein [Nitrospirales bacterium]